MFVYFYNYIKFTIFYNQISDCFHTDLTSPVRFCDKCVHSVETIAALWTKTAGELDMEIVGCWWYGQTRRKRESRSASGSVRLSIEHTTAISRSLKWREVQVEVGSLQNYSGTLLNASAFAITFLTRFRTTYLKKKIRLNYSNLDLANPRWAGVNLIL